MRKRLYREGYLVSKRIAVPICLIISTMVFFTVNCLGYDESKIYEDPGILMAHEILPPELLEGENYKVMEEVVTYDLTNVFTISSEFGQFEAIGKDMLRIRIQEILAIAALQEIKKTKAFRDAAEQAAMSPLKGAHNLIIHPVDTVTGIPRGIGRLFASEDNIFMGNIEYSITEEMVAFFKMKLQHAHILGVNVYSTNRILQKELNGATWAKFASGMGVKFNMEIFRSIYNAAFFSVNDAEFTQNMNQVILDNTPEDLARLNHKKLKQMSIREDLIEEFLNHSILTPRHQTFIVHALAEMKQTKNRKYFIEQANRSVYEEDAFFFQRIAEMMLDYHKNVESIVEIIPVRRAIVGYTDKKSIIATLPMDYVYWTERADKGIDALLQLESQDRPVKSMKLFITGKVTPRAKRELMDRGIIVKENM